ncbi:MAG: porin [Methylococcaceae bacterium]|jgi:phosphate-selective porin OprO/OprP
MYPKQALALAISINSLLALASLPSSANEQDKNEKISQLEHRLILLEQKLAEKEKNTALENTNNTVKTLDQKLKVLERQNEINQEATLEKAKTAAKFEVGAKGLSLSSANGDHSLRVRASIQSDARFFPDTPNTNDRFDLRQARIWLEGRVWKYIDYKLLPDFGNSQVILADAYIDLHYFPYASLEFGRQKTPISLERLQGDSDGTFLERAFPTQLASNRDNGIKLHGSFAQPGQTAEYAGPIDFKNFFTYELGVFNGGGDNGAANADRETDNNKEIVARLWSHPFQGSGINWLDGFGIGVAGSFEDPVRNATPIKNLTSALGQTTLVDYSQRGTGTNAVIADGEHYRIYPQAYWYYGQYGLLGEYVLSSQVLSGNAGRTHVKQDNQAWQVLASYVVTGENNSFSGVKPRAAFDPFAGHWGALQLAARWSELNIDPDTFNSINGSRLLNPAVSVSNARAWAVGFNWFLNANLLLRADYEHTDFTGGAGSTNAVRNRASEQVLATRLQLVF